MKVLIYYILPILLFTAQQDFAQSALANKYLDTAVAYQRTAKNYTKALKYYELAIKAGNDGNYTYYNAAQCACQVGETAKAIDYYKKGFANYLDYGNYPYFAADTLIKCFSNTSDWQYYLAIMKPKYDSVTAVHDNYLAGLNDPTKRINRSELTDSAKLISQLKNKSARELINWIKNYHDFKNPPKKDHGTMYHIRVDDSLSIPFYVYVPKSYDPQKKNKLYVFLHGAVSQRPSFYTTPMLYNDDQAVLKKPIENEAIVIYPLAKKGFNWLYVQDAFEAILKEISLVKSLYNIDDNRVYLGGHSDGGTGTFWMATHKSGIFAAFLGLNYNPKAYFGNTNLWNLTNETPFYGLSATDDGTFNIKGVINIKDYGKSIGDNWHGFTLKGDHGLPFNDATATYFAYDSLFRQARNPFPKHINWETDDVRNGRFAWLEIMQLDTLSAKADWQKTYTPPSITINDKPVNYNFNPHRSGVVEATIDGNVVHIRQARVKALTFYVSPELVDLRKPVTIYVNDKLVFNARIREDKNVIMDEFIKTKDRELIIVNKVKLSL